ncbi:hypothetical protein PC114_g5157 [Phytophthora cactorum]|uniref:Uncharacterized protein n=1 Tax=Phytophthora cactorum TaxID=29920 RepID=A0A8T1E4Q9_9STRA|nr:hypothetical protein PC114_g5157 [Phytophthora cactorum]KAG2947180.1 hypothetical protein PC117_g7005 [Phytophthora cactorum]KAG4061278.1 hypothetical protein PC123_g3825 [Phytophthora cactorum]
MSRAKNSTARTVDPMGNDRDYSALIYWAWCTWYKS